MFGQTFAPADLATIALLVVLEGLLSIDNALVLGLLAQQVHPRLRHKALSYGLVGAFFLRLAAVALAAYLLRWSVLKLAGGAYLLWISIQYFSRPRRQLPSPPRQTQSAGPRFWRAVAVIELTDLAFAVDSILAAVALVGPAPTGTPPNALHPKLWVIFTGGMLGVVLMRLAAVGFSSLLGQFPLLHRAAYLVILLIAVKLLLDWACNTAAHPHRIDFQDPHRVALWVFWVAVVICLGMGLKTRR